MPQRVPVAEPVGAGELTPEQLVREALTAESGEASGLYLRAADGFALRKDWRNAAALLPRIDPDRIPSRNQQTLDLLRAETHLFARSDPESAREYARRLDPHADPLRAARIMHLNADLCRTLNDYGCAAEWLMRLSETDEVDVPQQIEVAAGEPFPDTQYPAGTTPVPQIGLPGQAIPDETAIRVEMDPRRILHDEIWSLMARTHTDRATAGAASRESVIRGWWTLWLDASSASGPQQWLPGWRTRYPDHPANRSLPTLLQMRLMGGVTNADLAVLLPLSGAMAAAGTAIRDGIVSTFIQEGGTGRVTFYDTNEAPLGSLYERVLLNRHQAIVGPLSKNNVATLAALAPEIPSLVLNYLDDDVQAPPGMHQLGLAVEDEAETVVQRLVEHGAQSVLVFHTPEDWSIRAAQRFRQRWPWRSQLEEIENIKETTSAVGRGMLVDQSRQRLEDLARLIDHPLEFTPRARGDIDAIVVLADSLEARALVPAFRFHFASGIPVFSSSQAVRGSRVEQLQEIDGYHVTDLPWFIDGGDLAQSVTRGFSLEGNRLASLYALGADAYRVGGYLGAGQLPAYFTLEGATGTLSTDPQGRLHRTQAWAVVREGRLVPESKHRPEDNAPLAEDEDDPDRP